MHFIFKSIQLARKTGKMATSCYVWQCVQGWSLSFNPDTPETIFLHRIPIWYLHHHQALCQKLLQFQLVDDCLGCCLLRHNFHPYNQSCSRLHLSAEEWQSDLELEQCHLKYRFIPIAHEVSRASSNNSKNKLVIRYYANIHLLLYTCVLTWITQLNVIFSKWQEIPADITAFSKVSN